VAGSWRKMHNEELHNLHSSPSIVAVIKSKMIMWARQVTHMREMINT
jgi:hypothetical protein